MLVLDCPFELVEGALMTTHESNHSEQTVWTRMVRLPEKPFPVLVCAMDQLIMYIIPTIPNLHVNVEAGCFFAHGMITQI